LRLVRRVKKTKRERERNIGLALGALAAKECRLVEQALTRHNDYHRGIHNARRSCRRLRSLLAFHAMSADPQQAVKANKTLRQLTHSFSALRDAHVAIRTARRLMAAHAATLTPELVKQLEERSDALLADALEQDPDWQHRRSNVARVTKVIAALDWQTMTAPSAKDVLTQSVKRMKKARRKAMEQRTDEAFHRWRRRARQLRYQLEFLRKARHVSGAGKSHAVRYDNRVKRLSLIIDRLGWRQDFQVFLQTLEQLPQTAEVTALRAALAKTSTKATKA
jgi:CHAD domain-containing protein